ncbi:Sulfatase maturation enzyme AslB, radical SAM superfamily [Paenibacillus sophorae]|uniref:Radical SAM protein n=1 Tax=Paenibacillus sophorae TaxID=1333845 RepID=A0A1H8W4J7_9BACL
MNLIKEIYKQSGIDYFTDDYYSLIKSIQQINISENDKQFSFRENEDNSIYQSLAIEITQQNYCNLSCEWCYINQNKRGRKNKPISFEQFKEIIDKIDEFNRINNVKLFSIVVFMGGEPTLNKDLEKMIHYTLENNLKPIVVTNSLKLANNEYAKKICLNGVKIVTHIPFCPNNEETNLKLNKLSKNRIYSSRLFQAIENLVEIRKERHRFEIVGDFVVNKASIDYAFESYKYCRENGIEPFFEFMRMSNDSESNEKYMLDAQDIINIADKVYQYDLAHNYVNDTPLGKVRYYLPPAINNPCKLIQDSLHVTFTEEGFGNVTSCCGQDIAHGNIVSDSLESIIKHKAETKIFSEQTDHIKGPCSVCELYNISGCEAGCRGNANNIYHNPEASDPQCIFIREDVKESLELMLEKVL